MGAGEMAQKSTCYSCRRSEFLSQHPHSDAVTLAVTPIPEDPKKRRTFGFLDTNMHVV